MTRKIFNDPFHSIENSDDKIIDFNNYRYIPLKWIERGIAMYIHKHMNAYTNILVKIYSFTSKILFSASEIHIFKTA